ARFHDAGLEVVIDVVYNHTAEGNEKGPTLSFKGIDNCSYYRLIPDKKRYYINDTGTGNTLNLSHPRVIQMVADSLRYWVEEMHVDGFRFDLGSHNHKHNEANGEGNQDGTSNNRSWNHGAEGQTDDAGVKGLRKRQMKNMLATLLLSQGTPMMLAGDEFGRTQKGNNNAY